MPPRIEGLFWPPGAEDHVEEHINAWEIQELIEGDDFSVFRNTQGTLLVAGAWSGALRQECS